MSPAIAVAVAAVVFAIARVAEHADFPALEYMVHMDIPVAAHGVEQIGADVVDDFLDAFGGHGVVDGDGDMGDAGQKVGVNAAHRVVAVQNQPGFGAGGADFAFIIVGHRGNSTQFRSSQFRSSPGGSAERNARQGDAYSRIWPCPRITHL